MSNRTDAAGPAGGVGTLDVEEVVRRACSQAGGWDVWAFPPHDPTWVSAAPAGAVTATQGWKLHVSADAVSAPSVLERVLPVLVRARVPFKVAATTEILMLLNTSGSTQIGKFVTVYPRRDAESVEVAELLADATAGLVGPRVPSDQPLRPGSVVHYRFGAFNTAARRTPLGGLESTLVAPDGEVWPDAYETPPWAEDPFATAGDGQERDDLLVGGRFLRIAPLHHTYSTTAFMATDLETGATCVLKQTGRYRREARTYEAAILRKLPSASTRPEVIAVVEDDDGITLALEDVAGEPLVTASWKQGLEGVVPPVLDWAVALAAALAAIHDTGLVHSDLSPANVILTDDGPRLIDFELARAPTGERLEFGAGTLGFGSPEQLAAEGLAFTDDIYGLGALSFAALAGTAPPAEAGDDEVGASLRRLVPGVRPGLEQAITRCLARRRGDRFQSAREAGAAFAALREPSVDEVPFGAAPTTRAPEQAMRRAAELAGALADALCETALEDGDGLSWDAELRQRRNGVPYHDLDAGNAGPILALATLPPDLAARSRRILEASVAAVLDGPPEPEPLPGLYVGEAGVALALLAAAERLGDDAAVAAAGERLRVARAFPHRSPDVINGSAGRLIGHLALWRVTGAAEDLDAAVEAGEAIVAGAEPAPHDGLMWRQPEAYGLLSGTARLGYAHGAAGIGDALLDLFDATGDARWLRTAESVGRLLVGEARPVAGGRSVQWPDEPGGETVGGFWCVGSGGIARFLARLAHYAPGAQPSLVAAAGWSVARQSRSAAPIQCHGLAGNVELLVDLYRATGDDAFLAEARSLGEVLEAALFRSGTVELREPFGPDGYLVGKSGALLAFVRLADPDGSAHAIRPQLGAAEARAAA